MLKIFVNEMKTIIILKRANKKCSQLLYLATTTAHPYVTFTSMSLSPADPKVELPGNITVGIQGTVHHKFGTDVRMVVKMDKELLGQWTKVPCALNVGSW